MKLLKRNEGYFVGLLIAIESCIAFFAIVKFGVPILSSMGDYGEFFSLLAGLPLLALGAWKNFELMKFLGRLSIKTHLILVAISSTLLMLGGNLYKPESND